MAKTQRTGIDGYVLYADDDWLEFHARGSVGGPVAYVRGVGAAMKTLRAGSPVFLIRKGESPRRVHAWGVFQNDEVIAADLAWQRYGTRLGAPTQADWRALLGHLSNANRDRVRLVHLTNLAVPGAPVELDPQRVYIPKSPPKGWGLNLDDRNRIMEWCAFAAQTSLPDLDLADAGTGGEEGRRVMRQHLVLERDQAVVADAKRRWAQVNPLMACECCSFSFAKVYGERGRDYIEAHHRTPLAVLAARAFSLLT